jgi:two-component system chemotaxis response regulator CheB
MGADGTKGLVKMHAKGSYVVGQDEKTCVVYGMPRAAYEAGAVDVQLPIEQISSGVAKLCGLTII